MTVLLQIKYTHIKLESFCPLSNSFISSSSVDTHLVLEKIVSSRCITIPIECDGRSSAPYKRKNRV